MNITTISFRLKLFEDFQKAIYHNDAETGLKLFIDHYDQLVNRDILAFQLARLILEKCYVPPNQLRWPSGVSKSPAGAALIFITAQLSRLETAAGTDIIGLSGVPKGVRNLFARAWLIRPRCSLIYDLIFRHAFVNWLVQEASAIGPCLIACAHINDEQMVEMVQQHWMQLCLLHEDTPDFLLQASRFEILHPFVKKALKVCFALYAKNPSHLLTLFECAFQVEAFNQVISCSELLLQMDLDSESLNTIAAKRLVAFAETGRDNEVISEYQSLCSLPGFKFPSPERILYVFQKNGESDLEKSLLNQAVFSDETPEWVVLSHGLLTDSTSQQLLNKWVKLYEKEPQDERVLFGLTRCFLRVRPLAETEFLEEHLNQYWSSLLDYKEYRYLAGSFLVMLGAAKEENIETYESVLLPYSLENPLVRKAALRYIRALSCLKRWPDLESFLERKDIGLLHFVCSYDEIQYHRQMAAQADLPQTEDEIRTWIQGWENLLALPMQGTMVESFAGHFINLDCEIRQSPDFADMIVTNDYYQDLHIQIRRRTKGEAERIILLSGLDKKEADILKERLRRADIEAVHKVLLELTGHLIYKEDEYI